MAPWRSSGGSEVGAACGGPGSWQLWAGWLNTTCWQPGARLMACPAVPVRQLLLAYGTL